MGNLFNKMLYIVIGVALVPVLYETIDALPVTIPATVTALIAIIPIAFVALILAKSTQGK